MRSIRSSLEFPPRSANLAHQRTPLSSPRNDAWSTPARCRSKEPSMRTHACLRRLGVIGAGLLLVVGFIVSGQTVIPRAHAATVLTVNTNADIPCGGSTFSLRCAIEQANADVSGDTITFNIPSSTCCLIQLRTHLPTLTAVNTVKI